MTESRYETLDVAVPVAEVGGVWQLAQRAGIDTRTIHVASQRGLTIRTADRIATALDRHPAQLWPHWPDVLAEREAERRRQRQRDAYQRPEVAERRRRTAARYYAEAGDYVRARLRRKYQENRETHAARARARYRANRETINARRRARYALSRRDVLA